MTLIHVPELSAAQATQTTYDEFLVILDSLRLTPVQLSIDPLRRSVLVDGTPVGLCAKEFDLLTHLAVNSDRTVSRKELFETVWHGSGLDSTSRTLDAHIRRLRAKIGVEDLVTTIRGCGYRFNQAAHVELHIIPAHTLAA